MRKIFSTILLLTLSFCIVQVSAEETANVAVNGVMVKFDQPPVVIDGRTLVPIRAVAEQMNAGVRWEEESQTAGIIYNNTGVVLQVGNSNMVVQNLSTGETRAVRLEVPPQKYNDRTLMPIRALVEEFGCNVGWDNTSSTVIIATPDYTASQTAKTIIIGE